MNYDKSNIYLALIKYADIDKEKFIGDIDAYTFLINDGKNYYNFFHPELDYPVYRYAYSNDECSVEANNVILALEQGEEKDGFCYILSEDNFRIKNDAKIKFDTEYDIEQFMLYSPKFFIDRIDVINKRIKLMEAGELKNDLFDLDQYYSFQDMDEETNWYFMNSFNLEDNKVAQKKK